MAKSTQIDRSAVPLRDLIDTSGAFAASHGGREGPGKGCAGHEGRNAFWESVKDRTTILNAVFETQPHAKGVGLGTGIALGKIHLM